jgi:lipopolysaccharide export system permease protein
MIYNHSQDAGNTNVTIADSGKMEISQDKKFMTVTLYSGHSYSEERENRSGRDRRFPFRRETFEKEVINISMIGFEFNRRDERLWSNSSRMMNTKQLVFQGDSMFNDYNLRVWRFVTSLNYMSELNKQIAWLAMPYDSLRVNPELKPDTIVDIDKTIAAMGTFEKADLYQRAIDYVRGNSQIISQQMDEMYQRKKMVNSYAMEYHRKFTLSIACLIFFFIGAPLGAIIRKGGLGMPVVVSILMFIAYYMLMITGEKFAREDAWSMQSGMWFASLIFLPLGIWLTYKAATDSGIMSMESYQIFFNKLKDYISLKRQKSNLS